MPALLALLSDRERLVVSRHFGLDGKARTLRDIAGDLGVSAERVRQIEERALETLRTAWPATGELEFVQEADDLHDGRPNETGPAGKA